MKRLAEMTAFEKQEYFLFLRREVSNLLQSRSTGRARFALLVFDDDGPPQYVGNAERADLVRAFRDAAAFNKQTRLLWLGAGTAEERFAAGVKTLAREDVVSYHARFVRPNNAMLAVVGDVDAKSVIADLEKAFAAWKPAGEKVGDAYTPVPQLRGRTVLVVNKPEVTQTQIRLACMGVPRNHPDYYPIRVANTILGGGFTSRLVNEIRVNQGLTYSISSRFGMYRNAGTYSISTFTKNETIRKTVDATFAVVKKLQDEGPTDAELDKAKRYLTGQFPLGLQAPDALAAQLLDVEFYGLDPKFVESFSDKINAVTMTDCRRALKSYFCVDDLKILVVSKPEVAKKELEGLGAITVEEPK
jgi:zinc protease